MFKDKVKKIKKVSSIVNIDDLKIITEDDFATHKINYVKGVSRLRRGLYLLDKKLGSLKIANSLVSPSYISLETVLSRNSVIPDAVTSYLSVTTKPTKTYENKHGVFYYSTLKKNLYFGYKYKNGVFIAEVEKAILDYFYLRSESLRLTIYDYNNINREKYSSKGCLESFKWFKEERLENLEILDFDKLISYSKRFNKKVYNMSLLLKYYYQNNEQKFREIL